MNIPSAQLNLNAWRTPPATLCIRPGEIHIWRINLELPEAEINSWESLLSADECARANRFIFKKHRDAYIAARGALRQTLGLYLQADPRALRFTYATHGKPSLAAEHKAQDLRFNVSYSAGVALLALAVAMEIGIDIERVHDDFPYQEIALRFFAPAEYVLFCAAEAARRCETFFKYWTHKEAFIKAIGLGLSYPLNQFEVSLHPGAPVQLLSTPDPAPRHSLHFIAAGADYVGALAVMGICTDILLWAGGSNSA